MDNGLKEDKGWLRGDREGLMGDRYVVEGI